MNGCCEQELHQIYTSPHFTVPEATDGTCHFMLTQFKTRFPQYVCQGDAVLCARLRVSESYVAGFTDEQKVYDGIEFMAAHLSSIAAIAVTEDIGRRTAMVAGALARPGSNDWYGLSPWGLSFKQLQERNARIGVLFG